AVGARALRVHVQPTGQDQVRVQATDLTGAPVATIDSLVLRAAAPEHLTGARPAAGGAMFELSWPVLPLPREIPPPGRWAVLGADDLGLTALPEGSRPEVTIHPDMQSLRAALAAGDPAPGAVLVPFPAHLPPTPDPAAGLPEPAGPAAGPS